MPTIPFPLNPRPMKSQVPTWHLYLDVTKGIFKTFKTQFVNFLLRPGLPPVHLSLNTTTVCPGIQVTNLGVFLNILLSLIPKFNPLSSPAVIHPKHLLNVSISFPFSLLGHWATLLFLVWSTTIPSSSPQIHSCHFLIYSPQYNEYFLFFLLH